MESIYWFRAPDTEAALVSFKLGSAACIALVGSKPVRHRHLHIRENGVERFTLQHIHRFLAVSDHRYVAPLGFQEVTFLNRTWLGDGLPDDVAQIQRLAPARDGEFNEAWPAVSENVEAANRRRRLSAKADAKA